MTMDPEKWPDNPLHGEVMAVCKKIRQMLNEENDTLEHAGNPERHRVMITLPKAFIYFATYLAVFEPGKGGAEFWESMERGDFELNDKLPRAHRRQFLEGSLNKHFHELLELFESGKHPYLDPDWKPEKQDLDAEIPM